jgi:hypothetical protein
MPQGTLLFCPGMPLNLWNGGDRFKGIWFSLWARSGTGTGRSASSAEAGGSCSARSSSTAPCFVRDHLHPRRRFRVPLWILGREVLVYVDPCVAVAVPYYRIKALVSARTPQFPQRHDPMHLSRISHIRFVNSTVAILSGRTLSRLRYPGCESPYL